LALFAKAQNVKVDWDSERQVVRLGNEQVSLDQEQKLRINFVGPPGTFKVIPLSEALEAARGKRTLAVDLRGCIVIIGTTARSQQDYHATPYANNYARPLYRDSFGLMSGSEIQANLIATLHDRAFIYFLPRPVSVSILLLLGTTLGWAFARLNLTW